MATVTHPEPQTHPELQTQPEPTKTTRDKTGGEVRFLLEGVRWETYKALGDDLERAHSKIRITYDRGSMELMVVGREHEIYADRIDRLIDILTDAFGLPLDVGGSTTHQRDDLEKGFEPDRCYYIKNEPRMRGKMKLELPGDPPPDLTVEVDITSSSLDRMGIFAAIGVPEVWRFDGERFLVYHLQAEGKYAEASTSLSFPGLPLAEVERFLNLIPTMGLKEWSRAVREWVHREVVPRAQADA